MRHGPKKACTLVAPDYWQRLRISSTIFAGADCLKIGSTVMEAGAESAGVETPSKNSAAQSSDDEDDDDDEDDEDTLFVAPKKSSPAKASPGKSLKATAKAKAVVKKKGAKTNEEKPRSCSRSSSEPAS